jgi:hypothetical protein
MYVEKKVIFMIHAKCLVVFWYSKGHNATTIGRIPEFAKPVEKWERRTAIKTEKNQMTDFLRYKPLRSTFHSVPRFPTNIAREPERQGKP